MAEVPGAAERRLQEDFFRLARGLHPVAADPPFLLGADFLDRVGFLSSFPRRAVGFARSGSFLPPATCFRLFQQLEGRTLSDPLVAAISGPCFRNEEGYDAGRLPCFTMSELVILGDEESVSAARESLMRASLRLARRHGLDARLEEAQDSFFVAADKGKRLLQRLLGLKHELVAAGPDGPLAVASINHHQQFFGNRLNIRFGGEDAWSMCAAFGVERWRLCIEAGSG